MLVSVGLALVSAGSALVNVGLALVFTHDMPGKSRTGLFAGKESACGNDHSVQTILEMHKIYVFFRCDMLKKQMTAFLVGKQTPAAMTTASKEACKLLNIDEFPGHESLR